MNIYDKEHPHHTVWREATESVLAGTPKTIQFKDSNCSWSDTSVDSEGKYRLSWRLDTEYRIKPEMKKLRVNGQTFEYPVPFRGTLKHGQEYFTINIVDENLYRFKSNYNETTGKEDIDAGIVHLDCASAEMHSIVLRAINQL